MSKDEARHVLHCFKRETARPCRILYDLTAIDERVRANRQGQPDSDFTVVYHLSSYERNEDIRRAPLKGGTILTARTLALVWLGIYPATLVRIIQAAVGRLI